MACTSSSDYDEPYLPPAQVPPAAVPPSSGPVSHTDVAAARAAGLAAFLKAQATMPLIINGTDGADTLEGNANGNLMYGGAGNDTLRGGAGKDTLRGGAGNDTLDGGTDLDTAAYIGNRANFTIIRTATGWTVTDKTGAEGTDTLANIERLQFIDGNVALDTSGNAGQAWRLYQAALNRAPDKTGLDSQIQALDGGATLHQVAASFVNSREFASKYGPGLSNTAFVQQLYANTLHRAPDAAGLAAHVNALAHGADRADVLLAFSESPEYQATVIGSIGNGIVY